MKGPWIQTHGQDFDTGKPGKALQDIMQLDLWRIHTWQFDHLQASMADPGTVKLGTREIYIELLLIFKGFAFQLLNLQHTL